MELVHFLGWKESYALFSIKRGILPNEKHFDKVLVAHEGHWIDSKDMMFHRKYEFYEDAQKDLGKGLTFIKKEYSEFLKRSLFLFDFEYVSDGNYLLAVPTTGEEIYFEIYGVDQSGALVLLVEREL